MPSSVFRRPLLSAAACAGALLVSCDGSGSSGGATAPDVTAASASVFASWKTDSGIPLPDSVSWAAEGTSGGFTLSHPAPDSLAVSDTLPRALGKDSLLLSTWTSSLRTQVVRCRAGSGGRLSLERPATIDSVACRLLAKLDSLRAARAAGWGSASDPRDLQRRSLAKLFAASLLSGDARISGFPDRVPVGLDSLAMVDALLRGAVSAGCPVDSLARRFGLPPEPLRVRMRALWSTGGLSSLDTTILERGNLSLRGIPSELRMVEDSTILVPFSAAGLSTDAAVLRLESSDTTILASTSQRVAAVDTLVLRPKPDANGSLRLTLVLESGPRRDTLAVPVSVAPRNDAPTFRGAGDLVAPSGDGNRTFANWVDSVSPGPADESRQSVSFVVAVTGGEGLFSVLPSVDPKGTLSFAGRPGASGTATIRVKARDDGDSAGSNRNTSAEKVARITFNAPPSIALSVYQDTIESVSSATGYVRISDPETSADNLSVKVSVSDRSVLDPDSVLVASTGATRVFSILPIAHAIGKTLVIFTVRDTMGGSSSDTLIVFVRASINHAPTLRLASSGPVATTWKGAAAFPLASAVWDDRIPGQKGRFELRLASPSDSNLVRLSIDTAGILRWNALVDTSASVHFLVRARDDGGTANRGIDTSAWVDAVLNLVDTLLDRQGNVYHARRIGSQVWMTGNLRTDVDSSWCYNDSIEYCRTYGRLYQWHAAMGVSEVFDTALLGAVDTLSHRGICPVGWRLPSKSDIQTLVELAGGDTAGARLKSILWESDPGSDTYGFSALPAGQRNPSIPSLFIQAGEYTDFWTTTEYQADMAFNPYLSSYSSKVVMGGSKKRQAFSVRCMLQ